jgi:hypothetical protein
MMKSQDRFFVATAVFAAVLSDMPEQLSADLQPSRCTSLLCPSLRSPVDTWALLPTISSATGGADVTVILHAADPSPGKSRERLRKIACLAGAKRDRVMPSCLHGCIL